MSDLRATGDRIDALLDASSTGGPVERERAEELVRLVSDLYGAGLERVLDLLHEAGRLDEEALGLLAGDDLVASLLLVHGLHPYSVETRVERALESVRPYLGSHGGDVELVEVTEGTVQLRLLGSCDGCPSSSVTLKLAVEGAIEAAAPEIEVIVVETPSSEPSTLIPVEALRTRLNDDADAGGGEWHEVPRLSTLAPGDVVLATAGQTAVLACRIGSELFAFVDRCGRCEASLAGAALARRLGGAVGDAVLRCPACAARYEVRRAGRCLDDETLHLDPLPLITSHDSISVAAPSPVVT
jgi:Fe-S cluster biogenesis protein NfuA/nitrite reductase/ring-hydroxylating ferredoxin subunit